MSKISTCRSCHDPILWAVTETGKRIPLDADPVIGGNVALNGSTARVLSLEGQQLAAAQQRPRYVSHFSTCAHGSQWRKR